MTIYPVILAGGSGSRLWPLSRQNHPKQFLDVLGSGETLLQATIKRARACSHISPLIIANQEHRFLLQHQIEPLGLDASHTLLEPCSKNTTGAIALGALHALNADPEATVLILPADHYLANHDGFASALTLLAQQISSGDLGLLGIKPISASTQYGYIEMASEEQVSEVKGFIEKPSPALASELVQRPNLAWNSGMILAKAQAVYDALSVHVPNMLATVERAFLGSHKLYDFNVVGSEYQNIQSVPFDVSVLENSKNLKVCMLGQDWDDLGTWSSLLARRKALGTENFNVFNDDKTVLAFDTQDAVLVHNDDILFMASQDALADMSNIANHLQRHNLQHLLNRIDVHRPWGQFKVLAQDAHFIVKRLIVYPYAQISLQSHQYRRENWVVVKGTARVQLDDAVCHLGVGDSICIEQNQKHRLSNPSENMLEIIEVQSGEHLDEKDIIRYDDQYDRHL